MCGSDRVNAEAPAPAEDRARRPSGSSGGGSAEICKGRGLPDLVALAAVSKLNTISDINAPQVVLYLLPVPGAAVIRRDCSPYWVPLAVNLR